jgi:hypothetical protein
MKVDIKKISKLLGAKHLGKMKTKGGYFGAIQTASNFKDFMQEIEDEAKDEGPEAVLQLESLKKFFQEERISLENKMSNATYAFVFSGKNWQTSSADDWDMDVVELDGNEKVIGHRQIDGAICKILQTTSGKLIAITK